MGNGVFNVAKGRAVELHNRVDLADPATAGLIVVLLKVTEVDATLQDYATLDALLLAAGNTEANFTAYARKTLVAANVGPATVDNATDTYSCDVDDQTWTAAGGTLDNTLAKLLVCYAPDTGGADTTFIPLTFHDFVATTDGNDLIATVHVDGYYQAT